MPVRHSLVFIKMIGIIDELNLLICTYIHSDAGVSEVTEKLDELQLAAKYRSVAGVLASHQESRDVHLDSITIRFHGAELLVDSRLELNCGRRYGLIGLNGCGRHLAHGYSVLILNNTDVDQIFVIYCFSASWIFLFTFVNMEIHVFDPWTCISRVRYCFRIEWAVTKYLWPSNGAW